MSPDGESVVTGAGDETLRFWNIFSKNTAQRVSFFVIDIFIFSIKHLKGLVFCFWNFIFSKTLLKGLAFFVFEVSSSVKRCSKGWFFVIEIFIFSKTLLKGLVFLLLTFSHIQ